MRATGIVRRIDDLGRVVIPKEIRRNLHLKEGDPLELFVDKDNVVFRKYSFFAMEDYPKKLERILSGVMDKKDWALYDDYHQITKNNDFSECSWTEWEDRQVKEYFKPIDYKFTVYPILTDGDLLGYFVTTKPGMEAMMIVRMIAMDYKNE